MCTCVYAFIFVRSRPPFYRLSIINGEIGPKSHQFYPAKWLDFIGFSPKKCPLGKSSRGRFETVYLSLLNVEWGDSSYKRQQQQQQQPQPQPQPQPNSQLHRMISDGYPSQCFNVPMENHPFLIHDYQRFSRISPKLGLLWTFRLAIVHILFPSSFSSFSTCTRLKSHWDISMMSGPHFCKCRIVSASATAPAPIETSMAIFTPPPKTGNTSWHTKRLESSAWGQNWNMRGESFSVVFSCVFVIVLNIKLNQSTAIWVWSNLYRSSAINIFFMSILAQSWIFVPLP